jgi:ribosomal protein S27E
MITVFTCTADKCPNQNIEYKFEDAPKTVICGGCGTEIWGLDE